MSDPSSVPTSLRVLVSRSPLFSVLPDDALDAVVECLRPQPLDDGRYLFHADQSADRLYLVAEGELEVLREGPETLERLNTIGAGELVGELAVLRGAQRSASVRARGRALVYWMHAADFMTLVHRFPSLAVEVARRVATHFIRSERRWQGQARARVWCVHTSLPYAFVDALVDAALGHLDHDASQRVTVFTREPPPPRRRGQRPVHPRALQASLAADLDQEWERSALVVVHGDRAELADALPHAEALLLTADTPPQGEPPTTRRLEIARSGLPSRNRLKLRPGAPPSSVAPRAARNLLGRSVGVALGGGGALGYAHLGVLEVLDQLGVGIDYVLGTSMGAVMGATYVSRGTAALRERVEQMSRPRDWMTVVDPGVVTSGVLSGRRALRFLHDLLRTERFDALTIPFAAVALDIDASEERVLQEGSLPDAVRASLAVPGVFMPHRYDSPFGPDARYVDGCMINNVPVDAVRAMGADRVIGVHVMGRGPQLPSRARGRWARHLPGLAGLDRLYTAAQTYVVAMARSGERQVYMADVGLLPDTSGFGFHEFWRGAQIAECGRRATQQAADRLAVLGGAAPGPGEG